MLAENKNSFIKTHRGSIIAFLSCVFALVFSLLLHPIYETNDDPGMESLLYGTAVTSGTSYLIFINRILGIILRILVSVFPNVNWYFIMHYGICLLSIFVLIYVLNNKFRKFGIALGFIVLAAVMETLFDVQFTKTAALATIAGGIGLVYSIKEKKKFIFTIACIGLLLLASMMRMEALFSTCPFVFIVYFFEFLDMRKSDKTALRKFLICVLITVALITLCHAAGNFINAKTPGSAEFEQYNFYRSRIQDYNLNSDSLDSADSEIYMIHGWMNNDPNVFTVDRLKTLSAVYSSTKQSPAIPEVLSTYFTFITDMTMTQQVLLLSIISGLAIMLFSSKKKMYPLLLIGCFMMLELYLVYSGRYGVHRVDFGILVALLVSMFYLNNDLTPAIKKIIETYKIKIRKEIIIAIVSLVTGVIVLVLGYLPAAKQSAYRNYFHYLHAAFLDACSNDNYFYVIHPMAYDINTDRNIYDLPQDILQNRYCYMGGWGAGVAIPGQNYSGTTDTDTSIWEQCVDSENIRLVLHTESSSYCIETIEWYIEEHYCSNVESIIEYENEFIVVYRIVSAD